MTRASRRSFSTIAPAPPYGVTVMREVDAVVARGLAPHAIGGLPVLVVGVPRGDRAVGVIGAVVRGAERQPLRPEEVREPPLDGLVLLHRVLATRDPGLVGAEDEVE